MSDASVRTLAESCRLLRDAGGLGLGMMGCKRALQLAAEPDFGGDVLLAALYLDAGSLAVHVKSDRHHWNLARAQARIADFRARHPDLDDAFPVPQTPSPGIEPNAL